MQVGVLRESLHLLFGKGVKQDITQAYFWNELSINAKKNNPIMRSKSVAKREHLKGRMTNYQVDEAETLVRQCENQNYQRCGEPYSAHFPENALKKEGKISSAISAEDRLMTIKRLLDKGLISEDEAKAKRQEILSKM